MIRAFIFSLMATLIWADESVNVTVDRRDIIEGESITLTDSSAKIKVAIKLNMHALITSLSPTLLFL